MRCRECRALLWSFVDCELGDGQHRAVEQHLDGCAACRLAHERARLFPLQIGHVSAVSPPPDFTARLMRRIEVLPPPSELRAAYPPRRAGSFGGAGGATLAFAAAAAAALLGLVSSSFLALLDGRAAPAALTDPDLPLQSIAVALGGWLAAQLWAILSWPVLLALWGMQIVLAVLWFRIVAPRQRAG